MLKISQHPGHGSAPPPATQPLPEPGIFQQPWWLEAAAGPRLERANVVWNGVTVASLAFIREKKLGITRLEMPPYTRTLGPDLNLPPSGPAKQQRNLHRAVAALLEALPPHDRFQTTLAPGHPAAFPLAISGCSLGQNFTFRSRPSWNLDHHWTDLDGKTRNLIRTAGKELAVVDDSPIDELIELSSSEHGPRSRVDHSALHRLARAACPRGQMATLTARDQGGSAVAAATVVWDSAVLYFWQSSRRRTAAPSGAVPLLIWKAITMAHARGLIFDIDGYHSHSSARFVSRFALEPAPRSTVLHLSRRGRALQAAGRLFGRGSGLGVPPLASPAEDD